VGTVGANQVRAFDAVTGSPLWDSGGTIAGAVITAPTIANGQLFAAAWDGRVYAFQPAA